MEHVKALIVKFVMTTVILAIVLGLFFRVDFGEYLSISLITTVAAYILGDLFILPRFGNTAATISDFILAYILIWAVGNGVIDEIIPLGWASFWSALIIAIGEIFFHRYMKNDVLDEEANRTDSPRDPAYSSELGEENDVVSVKDFRKQNRRDDHHKEENE